MILEAHRDNYGTNLTKAIPSYQKYRNEMVRSEMVRNGAAGGAGHGGREQSARIA